MRGRQERTLMLSAGGRNSKKRRICWHCKGVWGVGLALVASARREIKKTLLFFDRFQLMMITSNVVLPHIRFLLFSNK